MEIRQRDVYLKSKRNRHTDFVASEIEPFVRHLRGNKNKLL
jgi:hypothetical protein